MSQPFLEAAGALAVVLAVGAGTLLVLPRATPAPPTQMTLLDIERPPAVRAEPQAVKSDAERVEDLQRELGAIAAEQKRLANELRAAMAARKERGRRRR